MLEEDEKQMARSLGFLDGKQDNPYTIKFTDKLDEAINNMALVDEQTKADFVRDAVIEKILKEKQRFDRMRLVFGNTTETLADNGSLGTTTEDIKKA